jgi:hypothetical protein
MTEITISTLAAVTAIVVWVWFRRRPVLEKPLAHNRRSDEQPPYKEAQVSHRIDVDLHAPITVDARQEQSTETPHEPTTKGFAPVPSQTVSTASEITEPTRVSTDAVEVASSPLPTQPLAAPTPAAPVEPVGSPPTSPPLTSVDVFVPSSNDAVSDNSDAVVCESDQTQPIAASPPIGILNNEEIVAPAETPGSDVSVPKTTTPAPHIDSAPADQTVTQPSMVDEQPAEIPALLETAAASLGPTTPLPGDETELASCKGTEPPLAEDEPRSKARSYSEPKPSPTKKISTKNEQKPDPTPRTDSSLPIRLQLVFGRGGGVKMLALVPHRREGMPSSIEVTAMDGCLRLSEWSGDSYEPVSVSGIANALSEGVVWQTLEGAQRWRWELCRREIYVLAAGDEFGLHGFVTRRKDQRLWLNTRHIVLVKESLREQVSAALAEAGCAPPEVCDSTTAGVPSGWVLFRDVVPTCAVKMRDEGHILNVLCPAHEIEPQFVGGIRLERNIWLVGFPPRIRFAGELGNGFQVLIDDHLALLANDGAFESPGWDAEGEHRLWFGDRAETYSLRTMKEEWDSWHAHDFGTGAAICGASTHRLDGARWRQVRVPAANPLLVGARPGEIFCCKPQHDVRSEIILAMVPFPPVWALPIDPVHADKRSARLVPLDSLEPVLVVEHSKGNRRVTGAVRLWVTVVNNAGRKQLALSVESDETKDLWRRYRAVAKQLWKKMR